MSIKRVTRLLKQKENIRLEFKESHTDLPGNIFETICAMLNREGGDILLGVSDNGAIKGVDPSRIDIITNNLVTLSNNTNKIDPPFILFPKVYQIKKHSIVHIQVPESSQLHRSASVVFDRSNDGDFRVTQPQAGQYASLRRPGVYTNKPYRRIRSAHGFCREAPSR